MKLVAALADVSGTNQKRPWLTVNSGVVWTPANNRKYQPGGIKLKAANVLWQALEKPREAYVSHEAACTQRERRGELDVPPAPAGRGDGGQHAGWPRDRQVLHGPCRRPHRVARGRGEFQGGWMDWLSSINPLYLASNGPCFSLSAPFTPSYKLVLFSQREGVGGGIVRTRGLRCVCEVS